MDRETWQVTVHGVVKELDRTESLSNHKKQHLKMDGWLKRKWALPTNSIQPNEEEKGQTDCNRTQHLP